MYNTFEMQIPGYFKSPSNRIVMTPDLNPGMLWFLVQV